MDLAYEFTEEDMAIEESVGFPKAYAKLCRHRHQFGFYSHGPPFTFTAYTLDQDEAERAREFDQTFPILNPKAKPTTKPKIFQSLLWKQLSHLGNAGFDPAVIRVDPYGNVLHYHADSASPLAWDIDHWFPYTRGGLTVPSNLRILQWQVCKKKENKLEFLIPWWDFQLGISVNQFLSIFASSNSDFRHRAFSFLFSEGENEELNASQTVESHSFPQHFLESKERSGLAPAAIVVNRKESYDSSLALRSLDYNRQQQTRHQSPLIGARKMKHISLKENENPYQAIVLARNSLKQREENEKMNSEIEKLDEEVNDMRRKNEEERATIQDLEIELIKRKRRAEKCRRLAETQSSYRTMLEKMIRDAMHQSVIYKEQVRLNQVASNALMARLEAQKAISDAAEKELYHKYRHRNELEKRLGPEWDQARKRSRTDNNYEDDALCEERENRPVHYFPGIKAKKTPLHKELRKFLEEEQRASAEEGSVITEKLLRLEIGGGGEGGEGKNKEKFEFPDFRKQEVEEEEDEESRQVRGKGNVEKWLQMLLENSKEDENATCQEEKNNEPEIVEEKEEENETEDIGNGKIQRETRRLYRSESARGFRRTPSSPSMIMGMRKGVDCIGKKPKVMGEDSDEEENHATENNSSSFIKSIKKKKAVKI